MLPEPPTHPAPLLARTWTCQSQPERRIVSAAIQLVIISAGHMGYNSVLLQYLTSGHVDWALRMAVFPTTYRAPLVQPDPEDQGTWYYDFNSPLYQELIPYWLDGLLSPLGARCSQAAYPATNPA